MLDIRDNQLINLDNNKSISRSRQSTRSQFLARVVRYQQIYLPYLSIYKITDLHQIRSKNIKIKTQSIPNFIWWWKIWQKEPKHFWNFNTEPHYGLVINLQSPNLLTSFQKTICRMNRLQICAWPSLDYCKI